MLRNVILAMGFTAIVVSTGCTKGCNDKNTDEAPTDAPTSEAAAPAGELKIEDQQIGTGAEAVAGKSVSVHYTGKLTDGTTFDSSHDRKEPFTFQLGVGQVIQGWDQGVAGMKVGGKRKLTIPPSLGYGDRPAGQIPPNSTLLFDVELLSVN